MNNTLIGILAALVIGGIIGYAGAGYQYSARIAKIEKAFPAPQTMTEISGTIRSISGNVLTLDTPSMNPFEDVPTVRKVTITSDTKLVKREAKDMKTFQQEMDEFQKAASASAAKTATSTAPAGALMPPEPFTETAISVSDLAAGDVVTVDAGKDVKTAASFNAVKVTVTGSAPVQPLAPAAASNTSAPDAASTAPAGAAPIVDEPQVRTDGGVAPIVNTPPPAKP